MCGIAGVFDTQSRYEIRRETLEQMANAIHHRGPDDSAYFIDGNLGLGFKRLSIIDISHGQQPFYSENRDVVLICNGEIYNYKDLRAKLVKKGYKFCSECDVEVIVHLYQEYGMKLLDQLNGQFAFALFDKKNRTLYLARDQFGICPLFYTLKNDVLLFGSEVKAILQHPMAESKLDLTGLDQIFSFPANVAPSTLFSGINALKPGTYMKVGEEGVESHVYWDLNYPLSSAGYSNHREEYYVEMLEELLHKSVKMRLIADVPVGFYLSGGLDSSLIGALIRKSNPSGHITSLSVGFPESGDREIDERSYQRLMAETIKSNHHEILFNWTEVAGRLEDVLYHCESPLKETYNTCSLALSQGMRDMNVKVTLCGEGADELFGGYFGYKFDQVRKEKEIEKDLEHLLEDQVREKLWGDPDFIYEQNQHQLKETKRALYSKEVVGKYASFDCLERLEIDKSKIIGRDIFHQRSYLDFKIRLGGHLIADHGDRMTYANSIEGRYPFLDIDLVEFVRSIPPHLNLKGMVEKYLLKQVARKHVPDEIINRQKFGFVAPGSPSLLKNKNEWINDLLSYEMIKRQGVFNPDTIERLKKMYQKDDFTLNPPYEADLLIVVITLGMLIDKFKIST